MWGQGKAEYEKIKTARIIPTRVGTRNLKEIFGKSARDHPHACGDKAFSYGKISPIIGSSPRVWGQEFPMTEYEEEDRIIPTRVGTSGVVGNVQD